MNSFGSIYVLVESGSSEIRYVGQTTTSLSQRLYRHLFKVTVSTRTDHRTTWLAKQVRRGTPPTIHLVQELDVQYLDDAEIFWIQEFRNRGCKLVNHHKGGNGGWIGMRNKPSPRKGVIVPAETRAMISAKLSGRALPETTKAKMKAARARDREEIRKRSYVAWQEGRAGNQWTTGKASAHEVSCLVCRRVCKGTSALKCHQTKSHKEHTNVIEF